MLKITSIRAGEAHKMFSKELSISAATFVSLIAIPGNAATIAYDYSISTQPASTEGVERSYLFAVPLFDPSLGQLNSVRNELNGFYNVHADYDLSSMENGSYLLGYQHNFFANGLGAQSSVPAYGNFDFFAFLVLAGQVGSYDLRVSFNGSSIPTEFAASAPFIGLGSFSLQLNEIFNVYSICLGVPCAPFSASGFAEYRGKVIYDYTPTSVPEPSIWAAMLAGFALTGIWLRNSRSASSTARLTGRAIARPTDTYRAVY